MSFAEPPPGRGGMTLRHDTGCGALVVVGAVVVEVVAAGLVELGGGVEVVGACVVDAGRVVLLSAGGWDVTGADEGVAMVVEGSVADGSWARFVFTETLVATSEDAPLPDVAVKYTATEAPIQSSAMPVRGPRARRMRSWLAFIVDTPSGAG
jgi:hypothetical protein